MATTLLNDNPLAETERRTKQAFAVRPPEIESGDVVLNTPGIPWVNGVVTGSHRPDVMWTVCTDVTVLRLAPATRCEVLR